MVMKKWCHKLIQSRQEFLLHAALNPDPDLTKSSTLSNNKQYNWKRRIFGLCLFLMFRVLIGRCTLERDVALSWQLLTLTYLQLWTCQPRKYTKTKHWHWETNNRNFLLKIAAKSVFEHLTMNPHCARRVSSNALFDLFCCQILQPMVNDCRKKAIRSSQTLATDHYPILKQLSLLPRTQSDHGEHLGPTICIFSHSFNLKHSLSLGNTLDWKLWVKSLLLIIFTSGGLKLSSFHDFNGSMW